MLVSETMFAASGAAPRRRRTIMVTERSASSELEERPSILAQLRAWSAKHPLRPADGGPPALCDPDEIPIAWVREALPMRRVSFRKEPRDADETAAIERVVAALERMPGHCDVEIDAHVRDALLQAVLGLDRAAYGALDAKVRERKVQAGKLRSAVRSLLCESAHGEAIELGMFLTGTLGDREAIPDLEILARHAELWPMAMFVLGFFKAGSVDLLWASANRVGCDDRKRILLAMAPRLAERPDVRAWILRTCGSSCDLSDVARSCAIAGDLAGALDEPGIDDRLFESACFIVQNMLGPTIEDYPDGVVTVERLMRHLIDRGVTLHHLYLVQRIGEWLEWPTQEPAFPRPPRRWVARFAAEEDATMRWQRRRALGWTDDVRARLMDDCLRLVRRPHWPALVRTTLVALDSDGEKGTLDTLEGNSLAWDVAPAVGVDLWEDAFRLWERSPPSGPPLYRLLETDDAARIERVVRLCERTFPGAIHEAAPHGPSTLAGSPLRHQFDALLGVMARHAIPSERLLALALRCGDLTSALAACALAELPTETWGDEVVAALHAVNGFEPHPDADECLPLLVERVKQPYRTEVDARRCQSSASRP